MYGLKITPLAYNDIDNALGYSSGNLMNPEAAAALFDEIEEKLQFVRACPYSYLDCQYYFVPLESYRHVVIGRYALFFRVREDRYEVELLRFLYGRMDFSKIKFAVE